MQQEGRDKIKDFIKKLSVETPLSCKEIVQLLNHIAINGNIEEAKKIYKEKGCDGILAYITMLDYRQNVIVGNWQVVK